MEIFESEKKKNSCGYRNTRIRLDGAYSPVDKYQDIFGKQKFFSLLSLPATFKEGFDQFSGTKNSHRVEIFKTLNRGYLGDEVKLRC